MRGSKKLTKRHEEIITGLLSFAAVMRRLFALVAIISMSGFLPLSSGAGFCASRPCCRTHPVSGLSFASHPACCNQTNCATATRNSEATCGKNGSEHRDLVAPAIIAEARPDYAVLASEVVPAFESPPASRLTTITVLRI
jgi:hypothetical protein